MRSGAPPFRIKRKIADAREVQRSVVQAMLRRDFQRVPPVPSIKVCQGNAAPVRVAGKLPKLHFNVHHNVAGLLDLANAAKIYFRTEPGDQGALYAKIAQVSAATYARQDEEKQRSAGQRQQAQKAGDPRQRTVKLCIVMGRNAGSQRFLL